MSKCLVRRPLHTVDMLKQVVTPCVCHMQQFDCVPAFLALDMASRLVLNQPTAGLCIFISLSFFAFPQLGCQSALS